MSMTNDRCARRRVQSIYFPIVIFYGNFFTWIWYVFSFSLNALRWIWKVVARELHFHIPPPPLSATRMLIMVSTRYVYTILYYKLNEVVSCRAMYCFYIKINSELPYQLQYYNKYIRQWKVCSFWKLLFIFSKNAYLSTKLSLQCSFNSIHIKVGGTCHS